MQAQLLRVVQERSYKRVGGNQWQKTDFRLVSATNRRLEEEVAAGRFRADLFYRIASVVVRLPPLRERPEDVLPLFEHFFAELTGSDDVPALDDAVRANLLRREYPGNVRDLRQLVARIACRHVGPGPITAGDVPEDERPSVELEDAAWRDSAFENGIRNALARGVGLKEIGRATAGSAIRTALQVSDGNVQRAARLLGVTARALQLRRAGNRGASADDGLGDAET
jgi:transcriptional regulator with PAS, ATPase and Fis domain